MSDAQTSLPIIASAAPAEFPAALALVFGRLEDPARKMQIAAALAEIEHSGHGRQIILVARRGSRIVAAVWLEIQPGGIASLWTPGLAVGESEATARAMIDLAVAKAGAFGVRLIQSLLETDAGPQADWLTQCGFRHTTDLLYLVSPREAFPSTELESEVVFEPLGGSGESGDLSGAGKSDTLMHGNLRSDQTVRLAAIVERTYEATLDCPFVQGLRPVEEVLQSYQAVGEFDAARWLMVREQNSGSDVGCLLLTNHPAQRQWELVYMGIVPEARGRGYGLEIVRRAQWLCGKSQAERLVLAVDAANSPAISMYAAAGFETWDRRSVFLRVEKSDRQKT